MFKRIINPAATVKYPAHWWKNLSIAKKLYLVVGIMAVLIAAELFILHFAMRSLSAVRAFVGGESLWSKAQKDAVFSLQQFEITKNESDFQSFLDYLKVPEGDHNARLELMKPNPNLAVVTEEFKKGKIHPDDIPGLIQLLQRFYWVTYIERAIDVWTKADAAMEQLHNTGIQYHDALIAKTQDRELILAYRSKIKTLNHELTVLEEEFSNVLGAGSRWLERIVFMLLILAVVIVETIGLSLTFLTSRTLSRGLNELIDASSKIGRGNFSKKVMINTEDELGKLGRSVNEMGRLLETSYREMETRVRDRTADLEKMAEQNAKLYADAKDALQVREEFLSIASHELKTPLTALQLQLQLIRETTKQASAADHEKILDKVDRALGQSKKLTSLIDELLDLTRIRLGKPQLRKEMCDLTKIAKEIVAQLLSTASRSGSQLNFKSDDSVNGQFDVMRTTQIITNLITNAIKYGNAKPIDVTVKKSENMAEIIVKDRGMGIPEKDQKRIFERFERGTAKSGSEGLGLGLYITKQLIDAHGGTVELVSNENAGSTFIVKLNLV